jgi:hypothetical protein
MRARLVKQGGKYRQAQATPGSIVSHRMQRISVSPGEILNADHYVFALGPWLGKVFPFLATKITPTRQKFSFSALLLAICASQKSNCRPGLTGARYPFFSVPGNHWRGFKIADDTRGPVIDASTMEREISEERLTAARAYQRMRFPAMAGSPLLESRVCQYENHRPQFHFGSPSRSGKRLDCWRRLGPRFQAWTSEG